MKTEWEKAIANLQKVISERDFETWITPIIFSHNTDNTLYLSVPTSFFKDWIEDNYRQLLTGALTITSGKPVSIEFIINDTEIDTIENLLTHQFQAYEQPKAATIDTTFTPLNTKYTFDLFVCGTGNQFAHAAAMAVAHNPSDTYNPLFIYGGVGLGKSHLLNAIGHTIKSTAPHLVVCYCSAEKFMYEMVNHLRNKKMDIFRNKFRNVDVLLIDDIQFISGKTGTQEEFFHTFNALYEQHKQLVITSDKFPREIPDLEERLRSRFEWGLIADIQPPDTETKIAILKKKSEINKIILPDDVIYFLASSETRNIRELEGLLIRLGAYSSLQHIPITIEMAKDNLKDILINNKKDITIEIIQKATSEILGVKISDIKSDKRHKNIVHARQIAIWICRDMTKFSYPDIGIKFGGKDHSTVIYAVKKIESLLQHDTKLSKTIDDIKNNILS